MSSDNIDVLIEMLLDEADAHAREALEFLAVSEEERLATKAERLERVAEAIRNAEGAIRRQKERLNQTTEPADTKLSLDQLISFEQTLANLRAYERASRGVRGDGPVLSDETRRVYTNNTLDTLLHRRRNGK